MSKSHQTNLSDICLLLFLHAKMSAFSPLIILFLSSWRGQEDVVWFILSFLIFNYVLEGEIGSMSFQCSPAKADAEYLLHYHLNLYAVSCKTITWISVMFIWWAKRKDETRFNTIYNNNEGNVSSNLHPRHLDPLYSSSCGLWKKLC